MHTLTPPTPPHGTASVTPWATENPDPKVVRPPVHPISMIVKMAGTLAMSSFSLGMTGDPWIALFVLVGYPAAWSVAWLISR